MEDLRLHACLMTLILVSCVLIICEQLATSLDTVL